VLNLIISVAVNLTTVALTHGSQNRGAVGTTMVVVQISLWFLQIVLAMCYETFFVGKYGATPGKMACKLRVVTAEGEPVSYGRACARYWAKQLNLFTLGIGYLMVAFDKEEHRGLHDRICNTRVVKR
jgi:uncharacterized RDD family membrane protein YckC